MPGFFSGADKLFIVVDAAGQVGAGHCLFSSGARVPNAAP
jgi:hypothetical protein